MIYTSKHSAIIFNSIKSRTCDIKQKSYDRPLFGSRPFDYQTSGYNHLVSQLVHAHACNMVGLYKGFEVKPDGD